MDTGDSSDDDTWKYVLAGVVGGIGLLILLSFLWNRYKECTYDPERDPDITEVVSAETGEAARRRQAQRAQQREYHDVGTAPAPYTGQTRRAWAEEERDEEQ